MRKHDVRKWLHAILDLLPVILIPVFMIYSHRHDVTERTDVDVTYKYQSNEVNSLDDLVADNIYQIDILDFNSFNNDYYIDVLAVEQIDLNYEELTYDSLYTENDIYLTFNYNSQNNMVFITVANQINVDLTYDLSSYSIRLYNCIFRYNEDNNHSLNNLFINNLPTYTDYNVIESVEINDEKSSVMNVFMDDFNNSIDKYFNMGNVFNLNGVYQWFNTNIFSGHAPTVIYSIWNIALYELCMDLLFLLYGLFMWFIDIVQNIMDKPFKSIK